MIWPHPYPRLRQFFLSAATVLIAALALVTGANAQTNTYSSRLLSSSFGQCIGVNGNGDVFYTGTSAPSTTYIADGLYEMAAVNGTVPTNQTATKLTIGLANVGCLAVDGHGNVFVMGGVVQNLDTIVELVAVNGSLPANPTVRTIITGATLFTDQIAADGSGNIFFITDTSTSDGGSEYVNEIAAVNGVIPDNPTVLTLVTRTESESSGLQFNLTINTPTAAPNGDLFYLDDGTVKKLAAVNGAIPPNPAPVNVFGVGGSATLGPIVADNNGDVFISVIVINNDGSITSSIREAVAVNGVIPANPTLVTIYSTPVDQFDPRDFAADSHGNLFAANVRFGVTENLLEFSPAAAGTLSIAPVTQNFPATPVGSVSMAQTSIITNGTAQSIYLSPATLTDASDFATSNNCNGIINNGKTCTVTFTFTPQSGGALSSTFSIHDLNTPNSPLTVALAGNGATTAAQAALTPATADFGSVTVGATATTKTFTLSNPGTAALSVSSITLTGANASNFAITANSCATAHVSVVRNPAAARVNPYDLPALPPAAACTITVSFTPTATGNVTAALTVTDAAGTQTSALTGAGTAPSTAAADFTMAATPATQSSYHGAAVTYSVQVNSADATHPYTNPVALSATGLPAGVTVSFSPASIVPGAAQAATSMMTVTIPQLSARNNTQPRGPHPFDGLPAGASLASLGFAWLYRKRKKLARLHLLLVAVSLAGIATTLTGCSNSSTGFATPATTSTITVTGTSGSTVHTTTVTLTIQ